jgi:hypothetical protein
MLSTLLALSKRLPAACTLRLPSVDSSLGGNHRLHVIQAERENGDGLENTPSETWW